jgi:hypothetical protein
MDRVRVPLTDAGLLPRALVPERIPRIGFRFHQIEQAMAAADRFTPIRGIVQSDPHSRLQGIFLLYTNRQMAASDDGCNTPFGGDPEACLPLSRSLLELFGGSGRRFQGESNVFKGAVPLQPDKISPEYATELCHRYKISTLVASYVDPAWYVSSSWVWQLPASFANSTARVIPCPQPSASARAVSELSDLVH